MTVEGDQLKVKLEGLLPSTTYTFSVLAENRVGRSEASQALRHTTLEEPPTGSPENIKVI